MCEEKLTVEKRTYESTSYTHKHTYSQLLLPLSGNLSIKTDCYDLNLDEKHLFFMSPGKLHTFFSVNRNQFLVLDIPRWIMSFSDDNSEELYQVIDERWEHLKYLFLQETNAQGINETSAIDLIRYASHYLQKEKRPLSIEYIHNHFHEKITLEKLAAVENFNTTYFSQWFTKKTGDNPSAYIQKVRLEKAKEYLIATEFSILEIAQMVGYENQATLTKLFNKFAGLTPSEFRRMQRTAKNS